MAYEYRKFYIDGQWVDPATPQDYTVTNPATEEPAGVISLGTTPDVDRAVAAARRAFDSFSQTSRDERRALLEKILVIYKKRYADFPHETTADQWFSESQFESYRALGAHILEQLGGPLTDASFDDFMKAAREHIAVVRRHNAENKP